MQFQCEKCGKTFKYKTHYRDHINRKKSCIQKTTIYQCELCGQTFNQKGHYTRHMNRITPCVPHEQALIYYKKQLHDALSKIEEQAKRIKELNQNPNKTSIISNNNSYNTTNIGMVNINVTQINAFGRENTDYLTDSDYQQAYDLGLKGLQLLVHKKYLDPKHPENWNIAITNLRGDTCKVMTSRGVQTQLRNEVTDLMYRNTNIDLEEYEGHQEIDRPDEHEIDQALYTDNKDTSRKYTKLIRQTDVKIYNQKADRTRYLGITS